MADIAKVRKVITLTGGFDSFDAILESQYKMMEKQLPEVLPVGISQDDINATMNIVRNAYAEIKPHIENIVVSGFVSSFSDAEIDKMLEYYSSPEGMSVQLKMPELAKRNFEQTSMLVNLVLIPNLTKKLEEKGQEIQNRIESEKNQNLSVN